MSKILLMWFPDPDTRGRWYSALSTSQNVGAALVPVLVSWAIATYGATMGGGENQTSEKDTGKASSTPTVGWEAALYLPGALAMATGLIMLCFLDGTDPTAAFAAASAAPSRKNITNNNNKNGAAVVVGKKEKGKGDDAGLTKLLQEQVFGNYRWVQ